jgi:hypothetical protein
MDEHELPIMRTFYALCVNNALLSKVVIEWLTLLIRTWQVPGSNVGPETGYSD